MKNEILYMLHRLISKLPWINQDEHMNKFFRKCGIFIGGGCHIYSNIVSAEPFLVHIGDDVTISTQVKFCTHDNSIIKINPKCPNLFGHINIGSNCFIGQNALLMYGVTLADNIIVAAGSVVCNSFDEERIIIGGNPARKIGTWEDFGKRYENKAMGRLEVSNRLMTSPEKFIKRKVKNG